MDLLFTDCSKTYQSQAMSNMTSNADFWLRGAEVTSPHGLARFKRALEGIVRVVCNKNIPVFLKDQNEVPSAHTDLQTITIGYSPEQPIDYTVGLAIHEALHCLLTQPLRSFDEIQMMYNRYAKSKKKLPLYCLGWLKRIQNIIEDVRIENYSKQHHIGFRGYIDTMNAILIYADSSEFLAQVQVEKTIDNYFEYILMAVYQHPDLVHLDALPGLREIIEVLDTAHFDRIQTNQDVFRLACQVFDLIKKQFRRKPRKSDSSQPMSQTLQQFIDGETIGAAFSEQILQAVAMVEAQQNSQSLLTSRFGNKDDLTIEYIENITVEGLPYFPFYSNNLPDKLRRTRAILNGFEIGDRMSDYLQIINEEYRTVQRRLDRGKIDSTLLWRSGINKTDVFYKQQIEERPKTIRLQVLCDYSGSMSGQKHLDALTFMATLVRATKLTETLDIELFLGIGQQLVKIYDSLKNNESTFHDLLKDIDSNGGVSPEHLHLATMQQPIVQRSEPTHLIVLTDGEPTGGCANPVEEDRQRVKELLRKGVGLKAFFIAEDTKTDATAFEYIYGQLGQILPSGDLLSLGLTLSNWMFDD
jgi:hypothetical protein